MNKKISLGLSLAILFLAIAITVAVTMSISMRTYNKLIKDLPNRAKMYQNVSEIDDIIRTNYYGFINESLLNSDVYAGYAEGLGDKYSYYLTASEYEVYKNELQGEKVGIGVIAYYDEAETAIYIAEISEKSPAAQSGLSKGDKIIAIDEEEVTAYNYEELIDKLNGDRLSSINVRYVHDGKEATAGVVKGYNAQSVYYSKNGTVGYIKITDFYSTTASQLKKAVDSLIKDGAASLIFDVRNTSGGTIEYAAQALDVLVPVASDGNSALALAKNKDGEVIDTFTSDADNIQMKMAVLINSGTAGPAELFACDLRDFGLAQLVGVTSAGNGTMQESFNLSNGGALILTVAEITPYVSESYNGVGLTPDYEVKLPSEKNAKLAILSQAEDDQYQKAYSLLNNVA
ncbi:MAG: PDZ domain-containing protein [Clostridia bacterium]|nr:PDZ domain-containing protein [Clostridia bacterium]